MKAYKLLNPLYLLVLMVFIIASCAKQPEALFTTDKTTINEGEAITFTNTSTDAEINEWDFGDGTTSTEASPKKTYSKAGTYNVTLNTFSKKKKKSDSKMLSISVNSVIIKASISGQEIIMPLDGNHEIVHGASNGLNPCGMGINTGMYSTSVGPTGGVTELQISKGGLHWECSNPAPNSDFKNFFAVGSYPYSINYENGIEIRYIDASGETWNTSLGSGDQSGSTFNIISSVEETIFGSYYVRVTGSFTCKLYNSSGSVKTVTGGTFNLPFENL